MTDNPVRRAPPRISLSGTEWKLFLVGGLGLAYAASLTAIATHAQGAASAPAAYTVSPGAGGVVWLDQLPTDSRPTVTLPWNWTVATAPSVARGAVSAQTVRAPRILTRTS